MKERVEKPWGYEIIWARTGDYVGKLLYIRKGHRLSLQFHVRKEETVYVQSGMMRFTVDEGFGLTDRVMRPGEEYHIAPGVKHRMEAIEDCEVFEVSTPHLDDVVRLDDSYGRADGGTPAARPAK